MSQRLGFFANSKEGDRPTQKGAKGGTAGTERSGQGVESFAFHC
jgi:hypothetical protein